MGVLSNEMGMGLSYAWLGNTASVSTTNTDLTSALVFGTSGAAFACRFVSPVSQTSASLSVYIYVAAKTGSPTSIKFDVYPGPSGGDDAQRPGTSGVLGTVTVDLSGITAPSWATFTISSVSLVAGTTYWAVFSNDTATPASNYISIRNRALNLWTNVRLPAYATTTGFSTDPSAISTGAECPICFAFNDGTLMGMPYVLSTNHASNTEDRGVRFRFSQSIKICGVSFAAIPPGIDFLKVYSGATEVASVTLDLTQITNNGAFISFGSPLTLSANTDYDFMATGVSTTTTFAKIDANNASSPPTDVLSLCYQNQSYVTGSTPGSYTVSSNSTSGIILIPDSFVASAGGGGVVKMAGDGGGFVG